MTNQAFDSRNQAQYDENSKIIEQAIAKIRSNRTLKPSIAEVCRLTGFHRNSFKVEGARGYVVELLEDIKNERNAKAEREKKEKRDKLKDLEELLNNARKELVYWFGRSDTLERDFNQMELRLARQKEQTDWYRKELDKERERAKGLVQELESTKELLRELK